MLVLPISRQEVSVTEARLGSKRRVQSKSFSFWLENALIYQKR